MAQFEFFRQAYSTNILSILAYEKQRGISPKYNFIYKSYQLKTLTYMSPNASLIVQHNS
jgi:hypothetical protein